jgi:predicted pyridoxine 5'-phosphate oxidase superfamily flavin-nucleotide-binding protein
MWDRPFFHEGMREFQDRYDGRPVAEAIETKRKHYEFWDDEKELIQSSPFFFIATTWQDYVDCSIRSGDPGFVRIVGSNALEYPEYDGNSMYRTIGNIARNPNVGLLFVRFDGRSRRIRVNGRAAILDDAASLGRHHGAKLVVRVEYEIYPNCPRYVPDMIGAGGDFTASPSIPRPGHGTPPSPEWKRRNYIRDILPKDDPHLDEVQGSPGID